MFYREGAFYVRLRSLALRISIRENIFQEDYLGSHVLNGYSVGDTGKI